MKQIHLCAAIAATLVAHQAYAQNTANSNSSSSASPTSNASSQSTGNNQSNSHTSSNNSSSSATQNSTSGATSANNNTQNLGSASNLNANITIVNPSPPAAAASDSVLRQNVTGETTQNQKLDATTRSESFSSGEHHQYIDYGGSYTIKNVPNVQAPPLISSNDTCMGSASGGFSVAGFGVSGGSTYTDEHCKRIKMSRELWNKGMKAASLALDCMDREAREALELTGFTCPQTLRAQRAAAEATQARLGPASPPAPAVTLVSYPPPLPAEVPAPVPVAEPPAPEASPFAAAAERMVVAPEPAAPLPPAEPSQVVRRVDDGGALQLRR